MVGSGATPKCKGRLAASEAWGRAMYQGQMDVLEKVLTSLQPESKERKKGLEV